MSSGLNRPASPPAGSSLTVAPVSFSIGATTYHRRRAPPVNRLGLHHHLLCVAFRCIWRSGVPEPGGAERWEDLGPQTRH